MRHADNQIAEEQHDRPIRLADLDPIQEQLDALRLKLSVQESAGDITDAAVMRLVQEVLRSRKRREKFFHNELFGEPAWDILLELYVAHHAQRKTSISGACYISGVPASTALRWIKRLEDEGWIRRSPDPFDRRRFWLSPTSRTLKAMNDYFANMRLKPA